MTFVFPRHFVVRKLYQKTLRGMKHLPHGRCFIPRKNDSCPTSQNVPRVLWGPNFRYRAQNSPSLGPTLRQVNPAHKSTSCFLNIHFNVIPPIYVQIFQEVFRIKLCINLAPLSHSATCRLYKLIQLILNYFINLTALGKEKVNKLYKALHYSFFFQFSVISLRS